MKKNELINVVVQAFYGNRTYTEIREEDLDTLILGRVGRGTINNSRDQIDRTIIRIPNTDNLVVVYNKYQEERKIKMKEEAFKMDGYILRPLATIPEEDIEIYSRCVACRMSAEGMLESLQEKDYENVMKYLAE